MEGLEIINFFSTFREWYTVKKEVAIRRKDDTRKSFSNNYFANTKITWKQSKIQ